jgi:raffinose/stachyose/melibiose transport system permease protein
MSKKQDTTGAVKRSNSRAPHINFKRRIRFGRGLLGTILAIIWIFPFYLMLTNSFKTQNGIFRDVIGLPIMSGKMKSFSTANYPNALADLNFFQTCLNSLLITIVSTLIIVVFASMAAYALERVSFKFSTVIFMLFTAAMLVPFQSVMIPLIATYGKLEMLNRMGLVFMYLGFGSSLAIFLYHGAIRGIPRSLDEAATIDGAGKFMVFWRVIFPMLGPTTVTVAILNVMWIWNDYLLPSLVINSPTTQTIPLSMFYFFGQYTKQWSLALAGLIIAIIPVIIFYFFMQKKIIKGVSEGAVK